MNTIKEENNNSRKKSNEPQVAMYMRAGNMEQLDFYIQASINNILQYKVAGLYIRTDCSNDMGMRYSIDNQRKILKDYCKQHQIQNIIEYIDIGKSGLDKNRQALQQMIQDIKDKKINIIIIRDVSRLFRELIAMKNFIEEDFMKDIEVISLDNSIDILKNVYDARILKETLNIDENTNNRDNLDDLSI